MKSKEKALLVAKLAQEKIAEDLVILDMTKVSSITDFFVIATASSVTRAQAIADNIEQGLVKEKQVLSSIEGYEEGHWLLVDAYDVVAHIFNEEARLFYNLESLWSDAPKVKICQRKQKTRSKKTSKRK